jgi:hypothetical protein
VLVAVSDPMHRTVARRMRGVNCTPLLTILPSKNTVFALFSGLLLKVAWQPGDSSAPSRVRALDGRRFVHRWSPVT